MMNEINLFPHNEMAFQKLDESLKSYPLAFIEHATGTGKSFILLKYLYLREKNNRILFISMHDEMFGQLFGEQMQTLGMSRNDFRCFDTMIYPNIIKYNMQDIINNYDCIVFDEAHHCGAPKWGEQVMELKKLVLATPGKRMIGATATGIRYLDDYTDVAEVYFDGYTVSRLPVSTSILKNLLPAPIVINTLSSCVDKYLGVAKKLSKLPRNNETLALKERMEALDEHIKHDSNVRNTLSKYGVKKGEKYIVFCSSIADLRQKKLEAQEWFKDIGPIKVFEAHSAQKKDVNMREIEEFGQKRDEISLMFAVDIFNEGFHIDGVDGILMFRKTKSPIIYFQQIGRALSFSVRKKQIKIFDFVDNISNNDVIYELYKEMISEARRLSLEEPERKEFYEEILRRFQIIDETTKIVDELNEIEKVIDGNYIEKTRIDYAISKLEEYRHFYPKTDFTKELGLNRINADYIRAFNCICRMSDELSVEQIDRLRSLNIHFSKEINLPKEERLKLLNGFKNIKELKEAEYQDFIRRYIAYYIENGRRPFSNGNLEEHSLYVEYRKYLMLLSPSKLNKLIKKFPFKATVEETILTGNYPDKDDIMQYVAYIKNKLSKGNGLDKIELRVMKKIVHTISLKDTSLIETINSYDSIDIKIEEAIAVIANYKREINPLERFENINILVGEKEVYSAIKVIYKYASRVTNAQFERLLELDIALPKLLSMTMDERLKLLGNYQSFYDRDKGDGVYIFKEYLDFVSCNGRRPCNGEQEIKLQEKYEQYLPKTSAVKLREICEVLKSYNIPLSFYEKVMNKEELDKETINNFLQSILEKLHKYIEINEVELKLLRAFKRNEYETSINLDDLIQNIIGIREINECLDNIKKLIASAEKDTLEMNRFLRLISSRSKFMTLKHIKILEGLGIEIAHELLDSIMSLSTSVNIFEDETITKKNFLDEFNSYISNKRKRPDKDTYLDMEYRNYLAKLAKIKVKKFLSILDSVNIPYTFEERVLMGEVISDEEIEKYVSFIKNKTKQGFLLDHLENRVVRNLCNRGLVRKNSLGHVNSLIKPVSEDEIERKIVNRLMDMVALNPAEPINYDESLYYISSHNRRRIEHFRMTLLSRNVFRKILKKLKEVQKPLADILTIEEYDEYEKYRSIEYNDLEVLNMLEEIRNLDSDYRFLSKGIERKEFIDKYINFIVLHHGVRPSLVSEDELEVGLAIEFSEVETLLNKSDLAKIDRAIKDSVLKETPVDFYKRFHDFIITMGRFPCGNSDNPQEVMLNNLYVNFVSQFTKEQLLELNKLKKKYKTATVRANLEFTKRNKLGYKK